MYSYWKRLFTNIVLIHLQLLSNNQNGFSSDAFTPSQHKPHSTFAPSDNLPSLPTITTSTTFTTVPTQIQMAKYGPSETTPDISDEEFAQWEASNEQRVQTQAHQFQTLLTDLTTLTPIENIPGLLTRNIELLLSMRGYEGAALLKGAIEEAEKTGDEERMERVAGAVDYITTFVEEFVNQAKEIDDTYKALLGKIIRCIAGSAGSGSGGSTRSDERLFDDLMSTEKPNFTPGFLRHLDGECSRIAAAPKTSPESTKMLQTIRLIQTRILEELGEDLGEGALVLSQLLGYEDRKERLAVLGAGLTVRDRKSVV